MRIIYLTWAAFGLFWLAAALTNKRTVERESLSEGLPYRVLLILGIALVFGAGSGGGRRVDALDRAGMMLSRHPAVVAGTFITVLGLVLAIWARVTIGRNWSASITLKQEHELITRGPYAVVRHLIYTALVAMSIGTALAAGTWGALLGVFLVFVSCWIKLQHEERLMQRHFPAAYPQYAARVKRIIPFIL